MLHKCPIKPENKGLKLPQLLVFFYSVSLLLFLKSTNVTLKNVVYLQVISLFFLHFIPVTALINSGHFNLTFYRDFRIIDITAVLLSLCNDDIMGRPVCLN